MPIKEDVKLGKDVMIYHENLVNLYGCTIGKNTKVASFVEIQSGVIIGENCKIEAFAFIPSGVLISNGVFIGPHVCFTNDKYPRAVNKNGQLLSSSEWQITETTVEDNVSIGANSTIVCGVHIGRGSMIGAGSLITKDVPRNTIVFGKDILYQKK